MTGGEKKGDDTKKIPKKNMIVKVYNITVLALLRNCV
jgi:hypothetical protein